MKEHDFEEIIIKYSELIEESLIFRGRQVNVRGKFVDLLFEDRHGQKLIIELKRGTILREHIGQLMDYEGHFLSPDDPTLRVMLVGNKVPINLRRSLDHHGFEWREFPVSFLIDFLNKRGDEEFRNFFSTEDLVLSISNKVESGALKMRKQATKVTKEDKQRRFFEELLNLCNKKTTLFSNVLPKGHKGYQNYKFSSIGKNGLEWSFEILKNVGRSGLRLSSSNKELYKTLESKKKEIEDAFGESLKWDYIEGRSEQYIRSDTQKGGLNDSENWSEIQNDMVDRLIRLEKVLYSYLF